MKWNWKYLLLIPLGALIAFIVAILMNSEEPKKYDYLYSMGNYDTTSIKIDPRVKPFIEEFMEDANYYGYDTNYVYKLNCIVMGDLHNVETDGEVKDLHGVCLTVETDDKKIGNIILSEELYYQDPIGFKLTVYHEIGHWYGKEHLPEMRSLEKMLVQSGVENLNKYVGIMHDGYNISSSKYIEATWDLLRHNFFVRDMDIREQKIYMRKYLQDQVDETISEVECDIEEYQDDPTEEMCAYLYELENLKIEMDTISMDKVRGMFIF